MSASNQSQVTKHELLDRSIFSLGSDERSSLEDLLNRVEGTVFHLEDLWRLMNDVWSELGLDSNRPDWNCLGRFYEHPVWLLNGLFVEKDPVSIAHRQAWRQWMREQAAQPSESLRVADYGGGFGSLAALLAEDPSVHVDLIEPHPQQAALRRFRDRDNVQFTPELGNTYDFIFCSDVLEHLPDPVGTLAELAEATRINGKLLFANNFHPVMHCHLPATFHLRYSFSLIARMAGLRSLGSLSCDHGQGFQRISGRPAPMVPLRLAEFLSKGHFRARQRVSSLRHRIPRGRSGTTCVFCI